MTVVIGDTWSGPGWDNAYNDYKTAFYDMLHKAEAKYNFKIDRQTVGSWGPEFADKIKISAADNNPAASVYVLDIRYVLTLVKSNSLLDISGVTSVDWDDAKWNSAVKELMTLNGKVYGFSAGSVPGSGLYYNKAILTELGIDPNLPYDLQKEGKWSWEEFEKICAQVSVDKNGDGKKDYYALAGISSDFASSILLSNGTYLVTKDANGLFKVNADAPETIAALEFVRSLNANGCIMSKPDNAMWDWDKTAFINGTSVFYAGSTSDTYNYQSLDYGFVCFPYGPAVGHCVNFSTAAGSVYVLANCEKAEAEAEDIIFAMDLYTAGPEGFDEVEQVVNSYSMKDSRAKETLRMMITDCPEVANPAILFSDFSGLWFSVDLTKGSSVQEALAPCLEKLNEMVSEVNNSLQ